HSGTAADILNGKLRVNFSQYTSSTAKLEELLETLLYDIYFHIIYADQMRSNEFCYQASRSEEGGVVRGSYLRGETYPVSSLEPGDRIRLHERLAKLTAEKIAAQLVFGKDSQIAGLKRRFAATCAKFKSGASVAELALEVASRRAVLHVEGHAGTLTESARQLTELLQAALPADPKEQQRAVNYIEAQAQAMAVFFEKIELISDFRVRLMSSAAFFGEGAHDRHGIAEVSMNGVGIVPVNRLSFGCISELKARVAAALTGFRYRKMVNDQQAVVHGQANLLLTSPMARDLLIKTFRLSGSRDPEKRADDVLDGQYDLSRFEMELKAMLSASGSRYVKVGWDEQGRVLCPLLDPGQMKDEILKTRSRGRVIVFAIRPTVGGRAVFFSCLPDDDENFIYYHLRGAIEFTGDGECKGIILQGGEPRDPDLFMKYHGYFGLYSEKDLMAILRNDMILAARRFMNSGLFDPHTEVGILYIDQNGVDQSEKVRLVDLARDILYRQHDAPQQNHPSYVPQTRILALGEVLFWYNYFHMKSRFGLLLNSEEREYLHAVRSFPYYENLMRHFPMIEISEVDSLPLVDSSGKKTGVRVGDLTMLRSWKPFLTTRDEQSDNTAVWKSQARTNASVLVSGFDDILNVMPREKISALDIGTGDGQFCALLAQMYPRRFDPIWGIDPSAPQQTLALEGAVITLKNVTLEEFSLWKSFEGFFDVIFINRPAIDVTGELMRSIVPLLRSRGLIIVNYYWHMVYTQIYNGFEEEKDVERFHDDFGRKIHESLDYFSVNTLDGYPLVERSYCSVPGLLVVFRKTSHPGILGRRSENAVAGNPAALLNGRSNASVLNGHIPLPLTSEFIERASVKVSVSGDKVFADELMSRHVPAMLSSGYLPEIGKRKIPESLDLNEFLIASFERVRIVLF
ncbi:MAG TPA: class I SAM-dependent methyltransferase, partial [Candidatus Omnitrophota bacterium]|nr:class I SAM-dependent methyltransferase [Candidatus Omnitrophota bacterium]